MRAITYLMVAAVWLILAVSCTKIIEVDVPDPEAMIVVEGRIENDVPPYVILTRNSPYFGGIDLNDLSSYFVNGASIWVSDGTDSIALIEFCVEQFPEEVQRELASQFGYNVGDSADVPNVCIYSIPQLIQYYLTGDANLYVGKVGKTYTLRIQAEGEELRSITTIPGLLSIDLSLRPHDDPKKDSLMTVLVTYDDPDTSGNYLRYFTKRNNDSFRPPLSSSVYDDFVIAGGVLTLPVERGQSREDDFGDAYGYFWKGDTVIVKFSAIDKAHYDFWRTVENDNGDTPFSAPIKVNGNVEGGLGVWGGYGSVYDTIIIPR